MSCGLQPLIEDLGGMGSGGWLPKLCGGDYELGNFISGLALSEGTGYWASRALLRHIPGVRSEPPGGEPVHPAGVVVGEAESGTVTRRSDATSQDWGRKYLFNGGCAYVDLNHLEVCLPEVLSAFDHVAYCHALYALAHQATVEINEKLPADNRVHVLANNSDGQGNSYGSHLNFLVTRKSWENLFHRKIHYQLFLAAYQVSSIVFTGLGKVGSENGALETRFQLSQRADFFEVLVGPQTTYRRPIVNSRDESLTTGCRFAGRSDATADRMSRLHVIFYDHNLCHVAAFLKVGVLQIVLAMIEAEQVNPRLALEDPVDAVKRWSHDRALAARAPLIDGTELTAVDLQFRFFEEAERFITAGGCGESVPHAEEILTLWGETLEQLAARRIEALAPRLDWALKFTLLELALRQRSELTWQSPELKHLDQLYSSLDPTEGLYWPYEKTGFTQRLISDRRIARCLHEPPTDTRAWTRAALLLMADPREIERVDWDYIRFRLWHPESPGFPRGCILNLANPLAHTREQTLRQLPAAGGLADALEALGAVACEPSARIPWRTGAADQGPAADPRQDWQEPSNPAAQGGSGAPWISDETQNDNSNP